MSSNITSTESSSASNNIPGQITCSIINGLNKGNETSDNKTNSLLVERKNMGVFEFCQINYSDEPKTLKVKEEGSCDIKKEIDEDPFSAETYENNTNNITNVGLDSTGYIPGQTTAVKVEDMETSQNIALTYKGSSENSSIPRQKIAFIFKHGLRNGNETITNFNTSLNSYIDALLDDENDTDLRKILERKIKLQKKHTTKIKCLESQTRRMKTKISSLKETIVDLKKKRLAESAHNVFCHNLFGEQLHRIMKIRQKNVSGVGSPRFTPEFKKFCLRLHSLSPKAYKYVRFAFKACLPHDKTISKWRREKLKEKNQDKSN